MACYEKFPLLAQYLIFFATLIYAGVAIWQLFAIRRQADIANRTLILSHRPRLKVRSVVLKDNLFQDQKITIEFEVINCGETEATFIDSKWAIWLKHINDPLPDLPMSPPYETDPPRPIVEPGTVLKEGEARSVRVYYDIPQKEDFDLQRAYFTVYLMGRIIYKDTLRQHYRTAFCRQSKAHEFTFTKFVAVDDVDYEYED